MLAKKWMKYFLQNDLFKNDVLRDFFRLEGTDHLKMLLAFVLFSFVGFNTKKCEIKFLSTNSIRKIKSKTKQKIHNNMFT